MNHSINGLFRIKKRKPKATHSGAKSGKLDSTVVVLPMYSLTKSELKYLSY